MNWLMLLPLGLFVLLVLFTFLALRIDSLKTLKRILLPLAGLFLLSLAIGALNSHFLRKVFYSPRLLFVLWLLLLLLLLVFVIKLITFFFFDFFFSRRLSANVPRQLKDVVVFLLYIVGLLLILNYYLNIKITVLLASSAILTVVVGFALQDILGNLFSGIVLNFEDSLKLGDWVRINDHVGRIEQFRWRSIKIRTIDNELVLIPNQMASKENVVVIESGQNPCALKFLVGAAFSQPPDRVIKTILEVLHSQSWVLAEPPPAVLVNDYADSAVVYEVKFWTRDYAQRNFHRSEARRQIWYAFRRHGIPIPYPSRDLYVRHEKEAGLTNEDLADALRHNPVLRTVGRRQFQNLLQGLDSQVYGAGETIIREGDAGEHFYQILSGRVDIRKGGRVVAKLKNGDFFGEISLVTGEPTTATVVAAEESTLIRLSSKHFKETVSMNTTMARTLSEVILIRQNELAAFSEEARRLEGDARRRKESATLFRRIIKYFGISGN